MNFVTLIFIICFQPIWGSLKLVNNGYDGVIVAIDHAVPEDPDLITKIKDSFKLASAVLFTATENRAYFKGVKILIPSTWTTYTADAVATSEKFTDLDVIIAKENPILGPGDKPYTLQLGGCGAPGSYIHVTPDFLKDESIRHKWQIRDAEGRSIVHEWAKYRWGVFDEFGYPYDKIFPIFYKDSQNNVMPNYCTNQPLDGDYKNLADGTSTCLNTAEGLPDDDCRFIVDNTKNILVSSSLMGIHHMKKVTKFCNAATHNKETKTKHNAKCGQKSVWEVMEQHEDFLNNANPVIVQKENTVFTTLKEASPKYCFVIDVGNGMATANRKFRAEKAIKNWIQNEVIGGSSIAVVTFGDTATVGQAMTTQKSEAISAIQIPATATTKCIGCGLKTALENVADIKNAMMILVVTPGDDSSAEDFDVLIAQIIAKNVDLKTILMGEGTEPELYALTNGASGETILIPDGDVGPMFDDALRGCLPPQLSKPVKVASIVLDINAANFVISGSIVIEDTLGKNIFVIIQCSDPGNSLNLPTIKDPTNVEPNDISKSVNYKMATVSVPMGDAGTWTGSISGTGVVGSKCSAEVFSEPRSLDNLPVTSDTAVVTDSMDNLENQMVYFTAFVMKGHLPILNAEVKAIIMSPDGTVVMTVTLLDDGVGADALKGDGIYMYTLSANLLTGDMIYSVKFAATSTSSTLVNLGSAAVSNRRKRETSYGAQIIKNLRRSKREMPVDATSSDYQCCGSSIDETNTESIAFDTRSSHGTIKTAKIITTTTVSTTASTVTMSTMSTGSTVASSTDTMSSPLNTGSTVSTLTTDTASSTLNTGSTVKPSSTDTSSTLNTGSTASTLTTDTASSTLNTGSTVSTLTTDTASSKLNTGSTVSTITADTTSSTLNTGSTVSTITADTTSSTLNTGSTVSTLKADTTTSTLNTGSTVSTLKADTTSSTLNTGSTVSTLTTDPLASTLSTMSADTASTTSGTTVVTVPSTTATTTPATTITLDDLETDDDKIAPGTVEIVGVYSDNGIDVYITFRTTGDDGSTGKASAYEIRMDHNDMTQVIKPSLTVPQSKVILKYVDSVSATLIKDANNLVTYHYKSTTPLSSKENYHVTVAALDDSGNYGLVSSIKTFQYIEKITLFSQEFWNEAYDELYRFLVSFWPVISSFLKILGQVLYDLFFAVIMGSIAGGIALAGVAIYLGGQTADCEGDSSENMSSYGLKRLKGAGPEDFVFVWS